MFDANQYILAQNARGGGEYLSTSMVNAANNASNVSNVVNTVNAQNVGIRNQEAMFNAQAAITDSDNTLKAKMFNAQQSNLEAEADSANIGIANNMINVGLQGISSSIGDRIKSGKEQDANLITWLNADKSGMSTEQLQLLNDRFINSLNAKSNKVTKKTKTKTTTNGS